MKKRFVIAMLAVASLAQAQVDSVLTDVRRELWGNVVVRHADSRVDFTDLHTGCSASRRSRAALPEEGNECNLFAVRTSALRHLGRPGIVSAMAEYDNYRIRNRVWNETSDYGVVAPYCAGDSIVGDLSGETYRFSGAYSIAVGQRWMLGAEIRYRSALEFSRSDPRPRNVISDMFLKLAAGRRFGGRMAAASVGVRLYSQKSDIDFYSDAGSMSIFHMTGLGSDYQRFAGDKYNSNFQGTGWQMSLEWLKPQSGGLQASMRVEGIAIEKILPSINYLTLCKVDRLDAGLTLGLVSSADDCFRAVNLEAGLKRRKGTENIFGAGSGGNYPKISSLRGYESTDARAALTAVETMRPTGWLKLKVAPAVAYWFGREEHKQVEREIENSSARLSLDLGADAALGLVRLMLDVDGECSRNLRSRWSAAGLQKQSSRLEVFEARVAYLSDDCLSLAGRLRTECHLGASKLYLDMSFVLIKYDECGLSKHGGVALGCVF